MVDVWGVDPGMLVEVVRCFPKLKSLTLKGIRRRRPGERVMEMATVMAGLEAVGRELEVVELGGVKEEAEFANWFGCWVAERRRGVREVRVEKGCEAVAGEVMRRVREGRGRAVEVLEGEKRAGRRWVLGGQGVWVQTVG